MESHWIVVPQSQSLIAADSALVGVESTPLLEHYRSKGVAPVKVALLHAILKEGFGKRLPDLSYLDSLAKHFEYSWVDSDFDWFWLDTELVLSKLFEMPAAAVEECLIELGASNIETVDDYVNLLLRFMEGREFVVNADLVQRRDNKDGLSSIDKSWFEQIFQHARKALRACWSPKG